MPNSMPDDDAVIRGTAALTERAKVRLAEIRADISSRLWPVNAGMSSAAFNELMDQMSLLQLRFELRSNGARGPVDTRTGPGDRRVATPMAPPAEKPRDDARVQSDAAARDASD